MYLRFIRVFETPDAVREEVAFDGPENVEMEAHNEVIDDFTAELQRRVTEEATAELDAEPTEIEVWKEDLTRVTFDEYISTARVVGMTDSLIEVDRGSAALADTPLFVEEVTGMELSAR